MRGFSRSIHWIHCTNFDEIELMFQYNTPRLNVGMDLGD